MRRNRVFKCISIGLSIFMLGSSLSGCGKGDRDETSDDSNGNETVASETTAAAVSATDILIDTIEIDQSSDYLFNPEEIMYLSGVKVSSDNAGVKYSLYDMDEDSVSELLVSVNDEVGVYMYDEAMNAAKKTDAFDEKLDDISSDSEVVWVDETQWADGSIYGVAAQTGDPGVKSDFYLSSNYDYLTEQKVSTQGDSVSLIDERDSVSEKKSEMFSDRDKYQGEDIERIRDIYDIATNWDKREEEGITPVKKYLGAIDNVSSISELSDYISNPEVDPFCIFLNFETSLNLSDTSHWIVKITSDDFSVLPRTYHTLPDFVEEERFSFDVVARDVLEKAGYSLNDIDTILDDCYDVENSLLDVAWIDEEEDESDSDELLEYLPVDTFVTKCENFPIDSLFEAYGISNGDVTVEYPEYLRTLDSMFVEENLTKLKNYCLAHTAFTASEYLDLDTANAYKNYLVPDATYLDASEYEDLYTEDELNESYFNKYTDSRGIMGVATENAYMTYFVDDEAKDDLTVLAYEIRDTFRDILSNEEWMSDAGKQAAIEKLDNMEFSILKPDKFIDSSYLSVDKDASYLDAYASLVVNTRKHNGELVGQERVKGDWRYDIRSEVTTTVNNCFYYGAFNQFFILDGFISDNTYRTDMTKEEKLATIGEVIGHELTHGFDPLGIQYDKDGNMVVTEDNPYGWMPEEDYNAFQERAGRLSDYFSSITPFPYNRCDGSLYSGEASADIAGMSIGLKIADKEENFDYDLYFRTHSKLWVKQTTLLVEQGDIFNEHPLGYLRINVTCQQFEEFYKTYDIKEGDLMYLAPENRINIW
ncbi:Predicted metalloendopeptidase [Lachnospiraceae bacterium NE2001]|nr:Predicted metalloendopeptidase [Lachnospiraceae bacterium NE2001]